MRVTMARMHLLLKTLLLSSALTLAASAKTLPAAQSSQTRKRTSWTPASGLSTTDTRSSRAGHPRLRSRPTNAPAGSLLTAGSLTARGDPPLPTVQDNELRARPERVVRVGP
jgi:hypothetical protein